MYYDEHSRPTGIRMVFLAPDGRLRAFLRALLYFALAIVIAFLAGRAVRGLAGGLSAPVRGAIGYAVINVVLLLEAWFFFVVFDRRGFRALGLWFYPGWGKELLLGVGFGAGLISAVVGSLVLSGLVHYRGLAAGPGAAQFAIWGGMLFLAAAFEEILTRGYAFQRLVESITPLGAVLVFSAIFGAGHLGNPNVNPLAVANTVLAGILLSVAYLKTRALWLPIGLHWSWNFLMGPVLSLPVSGLKSSEPFFRVAIVPPDWLSGGAYGPEGSVLLTVFCVVAILAAWRSEKLAPAAAMQGVLKMSPLRTQKRYNDFG